MGGLGITGCLNRIYGAPANRRKGCCMKGNFPDAAVLFYMFHCNLCRQLKGGGMEIIIKIMCLIVIYVGQGGRNGLSV